MSSPNSTDQFITQYKTLLKDFISLKSISTDPAFQSEIARTAAWLQNLLESAQFKTVIFTGYSNPIVYGYYEVDPNAETVLIYGHYDVQPAQKNDGWASDPFDLTETDGKLVARGVVDNKGQILIYIVTILQLIKQGKLKYNIKFLIEGAEETGGEGMSELLKDEADRLACDFCLISDGEMPYRPVVTASFRGILNMTITYTTAQNNLHSGLYGGAVPNAAQELSILISKLYDQSYQPLIPDFYTDQTQMTKQEKRRSLEIDTFKKSVMEHTGIQKFFFDEAGSFSGKIGFFTMLTITGLKSGYTDDGYANIVPSTAQAKINFRIAAHQDPSHVYENFKNFVLKNTPEYVTVAVSEPVDSASAIKIDLSSKKHQEVIRLLEHTYKNKVLIEYCGAIIPVVGDIQKYLKVEPILVSLANDDCNMHGVDENFDLGLIEKAFDFSTAFLGEDQAHLS